MSIFDEKIITVGGKEIHYRTEKLTNFSCRISPERSKRGISPEKIYNPDKSNNCVFCPNRVYLETPTFEIGERITIGESVTFPNLYPFAERHIVTAVTREHSPQSFTQKQIADALSGQCMGLQTAFMKADATPRSSASNISHLGRVEVYPSINWNYLSSAGASMAHPHMQGICDPYPTYLTRCYLKKSQEYYQNHHENYWNKLAESEEKSERYLFGSKETILWAASAVPLGEKEVRAYFSYSTIPEFEKNIEMFAEGLLRVITFYKSMGIHAFNMAIHFDKSDTDGNSTDPSENTFHAFASIIARINPNPKSTSDTAFMEKMHFEPIIVTLPEELGKMYREYLGDKN